jgi:hypothetical protein
MLEDIAVLTSGKALTEDLEDTMHATETAVEEGIVAGGGVALLRASRVLETLRLTHGSTPPPMSSTSRAASERRSREGRRFDVWRGCLGLQRLVDQSDRALLTSALLGRAELRVHPGEALLAFVEVSGFTQTVRIHLLTLTGMRLSRLFRSEHGASRA